MESVPLWLRIASAALLVTAVGLAWFGPPPRGARQPAAVQLFAAAALVLYAGAVATLILDRKGASAALVAAAILATCVAAWLGRASGDGQGGDGGGGGRRGGRPDGPVDWDALERDVGGGPRDPTAV